MKKECLIIFLILIVSSNVSAWDGERKGFILGAGLGTGFVSHTQKAKGCKSIDESNIGFSINGKIGYAPNNYLMIYNMGPGTFFKNIHILDDKKRMIVSGINGLGISYYFNKTAPSPYIMGGIGISIWRAEFEPDIDDLEGTGFIIGGGYEYKSRFSIEGHFSWANASKEISETDYKAKFFSINITLNVIGY